LCQYINILQYIRDRCVLSQRCPAVEIGLEG
jgi:hypothetical protein